MKALSGNFNQEKAKGAFTVVVKTVGSFAALVRTAAGSNISITDTSPCRDPEVTTIIGNFFQFQTISYHDTMTHCTDCTECILPSFVVMPFLKPTKLSTFSSPPLPSVLDMQEMEINASASSSLPETGHCLYALGKV